MIIITKKTPAKRLSRLLKKETVKSKIIDMGKFSNKLSWKGDALKIQKGMRDE